MIVTWEEETNQKLFVHPTSRGVTAASSRQVVRQINPAAILHHRKARSLSLPRIATNQVLNFDLKAIILPRLLTLVPTNISVKSHDDAGLAVEAVQNTKPKRIDNSSINKKNFPLSTALSDADLLTNSSFSMKRTRF